jgi:hypothetical protein
VSSRQTHSLIKDCLLLQRSRECEINTDRDAGATQLRSYYETTAIAPLAAFKRPLSVTSPLLLIPVLRLPAALCLLTSYFLAPITASLAAFATRNLMTVFACI